MPFGRKNIEVGKRVVGKKKGRERREKHLNLNVFKRGRGEAKMVRDIEG
jgi:hypothetical protein